ncbi:hypothetical protein DPX16_7297 [Anabarilius grahami]|uniref:Uncharacterized protein n=1 Tax=Anabarilius grahami TaxID=495550 RepID=A0A3N0Z2M8_ANAGA|nr:hypothetical protein DPX16_7297 [Anabarilius grahami]
MTTAKRLSENRFGAEKRSIRDWVRPSGERGKLVVKEEGRFRDIPSSPVNMSREIEAFFGPLPPGKVMKYVISLLNHVWRLDVCFHVVLGKRFHWPRMSGWSLSYIPAVNPVPGLSDWCHCTRRGPCVGRKRPPFSLGDHICPY